MVFQVKERRLRAFENGAGLSWECNRRLEKTAW